jgi:uncharacterized protein DUF1203
MSQLDFSITPLPADRLQAIRDRGHDDFGNPAKEVVGGDGGSPLRCCLRDSRPGERLLLVACSPFDQPGPYAEVGPVFIHAAPCDGYAAAGEYPPAYRSRPQVFRTYRADGTIAGGRLVTPDESQETAIRELLAEPGVAYLHSRNVVFGCYMFAVHPAR